MTTIFALVILLYYPGEPALNHYQFDRDWVFRTAEQCEQLRKTIADIPPTKERPTAGIKYICMQKDAATWQPVY